MRTFQVLIPILLISLLAALIPSEAAAQETALLLPMRGEGSNPNARRAATTSLRRRLEARGYRVELLRDGIPPADAEAAELGEIATRRNASLVVDPVLEEFAGMMSLRIRLVAANGELLGEHSNLASTNTLPQDASRGLAEVLNTVPAAPTASPSAVEAPWEAPMPQARAPRDRPEGAEPRVRSAEDRPEVRRRPRRRRRPRWNHRRWWLGANFEPAMGTNRSSFNLMTGIRGEFNWRGLTLAANFNYTYVIDWEPASDPDYHTVSLFGMIGYQIRLGSDRLYLPLLAGAGYIPGNGAILRIEAGLAIKPTDRIDIRVSFVCPNFWFLETDMVLFTSLSLSLLVGF